MQSIDAVVKMNLINQKIANFCAQFTEYYPLLNPGKISQDIVQHPPCGGPDAWRQSAIFWGEAHFMLSEIANNTWAAILDLMNYWKSPASNAMAQIFMKYIEWLSATAETANAVKDYAHAMVAAHQNACNEVMPLGQILYNRFLYAELTKENAFLNFRNIQKIEYEYQFMRMENVAVMYRYTTRMLEAVRDLTVKQFSPPPWDVSAWDFMNKNLLPQACSPITIPVGVAPPPRPLHTVDLPPLTTTSVNQNQAPTPRLTQ